MGTSWANGSLLKFLVSSLLVHVSFPAEAGTSPEGHEEACTTIDRVQAHKLEQRSTAPRGRRLESGAKCCTPEVGSYMRSDTDDVTSLTVGYPSTFD